METDKRPLCVWWVVILTNILTLVYIGVANLSGNGTYGSIVEYAQILGLAIALSVVPTVLSKLGFRLLGYGVPIILAVWGAVKIANCSGWFCGIEGALPIGSALVFLLFYLLGVYLARLDSKVVFSLIILQVTALLLSLAFFVYLISANSSFENKISSNRSGNMADAFQICESAPALGRKSSCIDEVWSKAISENPGKDVCTSVGGYRQNCIDQMAGAYLSRDKCPEEINTYNKETGYSDDVGQYQRMKSCWIEMSKKYPSINICNATYGYQSKTTNTCMEVLENTK